MHWYPSRLRASAFCGRQTQTPSSVDIVDRILRGFGTKLLSASRRRCGLSASMLPGSMDRHQTGKRGPSRYTVESDMHSSLCFAARCAVDRTLISFYCISNRSTGLFYVSHVRAIRRTGALLYARLSDFEQVLPASVQLPITLCARVSSACRTALPHFRPGATNLQIHLLDVFQSRASN